MKILIFLPTYNESENIESLIKLIFKINSHFHVLVVDDQSPDGTSRIVKNLQKEYEHLYLIERPPPRGRGLAGMAGFQYALEKGYDMLVELDADFSHDPRDIPSLLEAITGSDVVIGSRFAKGGTDSERGFVRRIVSVISSTYIRLVLGVKVKDCTSGFRVFNHRALEKIQPGSLTARGPETVEEILFRCYRSGCSIVESPIHFQKRSAGKSKLHLKTLLSVLLKILKLRLTGSI